MPAITISITGEPTLAERLIMTLDISGTGQDTTSILPPYALYSPPPIRPLCTNCYFSTPDLQPRIDQCATRPICQNGNVLFVI